MRAALTLSRIAMMAVVLTALWRPVGAGGESVSYYIHQTNGMRVHVIEANLNDPSLLVKPVFARHAEGARQPFAAFLVAHPLAQITGGYFDLISGFPVGDAMVHGQRFYEGPVGSALAVTAENRASIIDTPAYVLNEWTGFDNVLQGGIRLVEHGQFAVYPYDQGFRDPDLFRRASRTAVGLTPENHLLLVATSQPIYLSQLAYIMIDLGCREAMTLDGGTSTGLAYGSSIILQPGRALPEVLQIVRRVVPPPVPDTRTPRKERQREQWTQPPEENPTLPRITADPSRHPELRMPPTTTQPADIDGAAGIPPEEPAPFVNATASPALLENRLPDVTEPQKRYQGKRQTVHAREEST
ncbi:MAG TPA: phosphodiester glycosidase family protein [Armatimonadota bacterium]